MEETNPLTFAGLRESISNAILDAWLRVLNFLPRLLACLVVILVGLLVAYVLRWAIIQVLNAIRLEVLVERVRLSEILKKMNLKKSASELIGELVKWVVIIVFLIPAMETLGLARVSDVLNQVLGYLPNVVVAGFLVLVGIIVADVLAGLVKATALTLGTNTANILASLTKYAIYIFVGLSALVELGVATSLLLSAFTGVIAMIAIAGGLAFGLGGKDAAAELIKKVKEDFSKKQ
jgi:hypothetical protein